MNKKIVVIGSSNIDLFMKVKYFPKPGETIIGDEVYKLFGGKGANQAVAAARADGNVIFISSVGNDIDGISCLKNLTKEGIDTHKIKKTSDKPTGLAMIFVDELGENSIAVSSGANQCLTMEDIVLSSDLIKNADILLIQLEIPIATVKTALKIAHENNVKVILNPAPALQIEDELFKYISVITPNIHEAEQLSGIKIKSKDDANKVAVYFFQKGINNVIITNGGDGVYIYTKYGADYLEAFKVNAVDTTGAGDIFNGTLAAALSRGNNILEAVKYATAAAAISVTTKGAQSSAPTNSEIEKFLSNTNLDQSFIHLKGVENEKV